MRQLSRQFDGALRALLGSLLTLLLLTTVHPAAPQAAEPWMWDQDDDALDDRLTDVFKNGISYAYENGDPEGRLRFEVAVIGQVLQYGGYVRFDHLPTPADSLRLRLLGADVVTRFVTAPYIRVRAPYLALVLIAAESDVERVEAATLMYPLNWLAARATGIRSGRGAPFPTIETRETLTGAGVVVAVLDTGINDSPQGPWPGHEELVGKVAGGAQFSGPGPTGYTPPSQSVNPSQTALGLTSYHGTHVAGTIAGGAAGGLLAGVAPGATLIDVKVLDDGGTGFGLPEALEWCILNRNRAWGDGHAGIDIINASLSSTDASDGHDCASTLVNIARASGVLVVTAAGNSGWSGALPSPAAADGALSVGALDPAGTDDTSDDALAAFTNAGPRTSDGDAEAMDELKPELTAPGVGVISSWGSMLGTGRAHRAASGTSMAAAVVSGAAALLLEADPTLTPDALEALLISTARHAASPPPSPDPLWDPRHGYGAVDLAAALEELRRPHRTQFVHLDAQWDVPGAAVSLEWATQRELDLTGFGIERASDIAGAPGPWGVVPPANIPALGSSSLAASNRTPYQVLDTPPAAGIYWYRIVTVGGVLSDVSPPIRVRADAPIGEARFTIGHPSPDEDVALALGSGLPLSAPAWLQVLPTAAVVEAISAPPVVGAEPDVYSAVVSLFDGGSGGPMLPPTPADPLWLRLDESGRPETSGSIEMFSLTLGATTLQTETPLPVPAPEGASVYAWIPTPQVSVAIPIDPPTTRRILASPNPFQGFVRLQGFDAPGLGTVLDVSVFDAMGRLVRRLGDALRDEAGSIEWDGCDEQASPVAAGSYYVRVRTPAAQYVIQVVRLP